MSEVEGSLRLWMRTARTSRLAGIPMMTLMHWMVRSKRMPSTCSSHRSNTLKGFSVALMSPVVLSWGYCVGAEVTLRDQDTLLSMLLQLHKPGLWWENNKKFERLYLIMPLHQQQPETFCFSCCPSVRPTPVNMISKECFEWITSHFVPMFTWTKNWIDSILVA